MKSKIILLILPYGSVGGMERLAFSFYNFYKKEGYQIKALKLIKLNNDIINFNKDELYMSDKDLNEMTRIERLYFYLSMPIKIRKIITKHNITHTISFGDVANFFSSLTFTEDYKIGSIHALKSVELSTISLFTKMSKLGYKYTYKNLDKVVCISNAIKKDLINKCEFKFIKKLKVIYNPHDIEEIQKKSIEIIDKQIEIDLLNSNSILFLGRLSIQKAPWHLVKAFSLVLKTIPNSNLIIIGDGDETVTKYIEKLIKELKIENNIHFFGRKSNPYKYLKKAKVLALSSHYEGTPNVIVEAIALGVPVVSSCCTDGIIELMSLNKVNVIKDYIKVEAGVITPNLYKGKLGLPVNNKFISEEFCLAEGLKEVLVSKEFNKVSVDKKQKLLSKFNLETVANNYLI